MSRVYTHSWVWLFMGKLTGQNNEMERAKGSRRQLQPQAQLRMVLAEARRRHLRQYLRGRLVWLETQACLLKERLRCCNLRYKPSHLL